MQKYYIFTIDDNIRFFKELTQSNAISIFSHPYVSLLKYLHEKYNVKIQLNLFYQDDTFNLSHMSNIYQEKFKANSDWLKLSFHSRMENVSPYQNANYDEIYEDCNTVQREILRFAGKESLALTTTIHYCQTTLEGREALKDCSVRGLLGLYGTENTPRSSYLCPETECQAIRNGKIVHCENIAFAGIDIVLNNFHTEEILKRLYALKNRKIIKIMIHEQYFYKDYSSYLPDFKERLEAAFHFLQTNYFNSCFFEELV